MAASPTAQRVRIGDFEFDRTTGELCSTTGGHATRLAPQPARLLELLVGKAGELLTREEIRDELWPDTHIDFDRSLHFCVRQVRAALDDSADDPSYVETLPRRGYRLMRPVEAPIEARTEDPIELATDGDDLRRRPRPAGRRGWGLTATILVAAAIPLGLFLTRGREAPVAGGSTAIRLAIMPFERAAQGAASEDLARLTEWLVAELAGGWSGQLDVVGPRSTAPYSNFPFPDLRRLRAELEVDYVLNARYFERDGASQLIVELIRLDDGAHPWAEFFGETPSWPAVGEQVRDRVVEALELAPSELAPSR